MKSSPRRLATFSLEIKKFFLISAPTAKIFFNLRPKTPNAPMEVEELTFRGKLKFPGMLRPPAVNWLPN